VIQVEKKKMGRPTESRKGNDIKVRIDDKTHEELLKYCAGHQITKAEAIRQGIHLVLKQN